MHYNARPPQLPELLLTVLLLLNTINNVCPNSNIVKENKGCAPEVQHCKNGTAKAYDIPIEVDCIYIDRKSGDLLNDKFPCVAASSRINIHGKPNELDHGAGVGTPFDLGFTAAAIHLAAGNF